MPKRSVPTLDWKKTAAAVGEVLGKTSLDDRVVKALDALDGGPVTLAFSGGADSLAALLLAFHHWPASRAQMTALHFNHALRGDGSDADERFCGDVCGALGIKFISERWVRPAGLISVSEQVARKARHDFFRGAMAQVGAKILVLGHHQNDVLETLLIRLTRGSGSGGLAAPRPIQTWNDGRIYLRPLLPVAKSRIVSAIEGAGAKWCDDHTNSELLFLRNRIRNTVVGPLMDATPDVDVLAAAAATRELMQEDDDALSERVQVLWPGSMRDTTLPLENFTEEPRAVLRRAVHRWRIANELELSKPALESLLHGCALGKPARFSVGVGKFAVIGHGKLTLENPDNDPPVPAAVRVEIDSGSKKWGSGLVGAHRIQLTQSGRKDILTGAFSNHKEVFLTVGVSLKFLEVRSWRAGDRFRPLGMQTEVKLQDLFTNKKVPRALRATLPVITTVSGEILWVPGFPPADRYKVHSSARIVLHLTYGAEPPL